MTKSGSEGTGCKTDAEKDRKKKLRMKAQQKKNKNC